MALSFNGNGTSGSSTAVKSLQSSDYSMTLTATQINRLLSGGSSASATTNQRTFTTITGATIAPDQQLQATINGAKLMGVPNFTWSVSNTAVATISAGGYLTYVANGTVTVYAVSKDYPVIGSLTLTLTSATGSSVTTFTGWTPNTLLPYSMNAEVDALITANGSNLSLLSSANDTTGAYVRNTALWTGNASGYTPSTTLAAGSAVDFSGVSVWSNRSDGYTTKFQITLISPTDALGPAHSLPANGTTYKFVDNSNVTYTAIVLSSTPGTTVAATNFIGLYWSGVGGTTTFLTDVGLIHLKWVDGNGNTISPPSSIKYYKILPSNYEHFVVDGNLNYIPVIGIDQERNVFINDSTNIGTAPYYPFTYYGSGSSGGAFFIKNNATETNRAPYNPVGPGGQTLWSGDSGMPIFVLIKGEPILIGGNTTALYTTSLADNQSAINTTLTALGSSYSLTTVNLTGLGYTTQS